ncbi:MAG: hypothetical protein ABI445_11650 [Polyangia bacterium]
MKNVRTEKREQDNTDDKPAKRTRRGTRGGTARRASKPADATAVRP